MTPRPQPKAKPLHGHALLVLLDVDVLFRGDPTETAPGLLPSLVALFEGRAP